MRRRGLLGSVLLGLGGALALVFLAGPLVVIVALSFTSTEFLRFPPSGFSLRWYHAFLEDWTYVEAFRASLLLAAGSAVGAVAVGVPAALGLARGRFPGRNSLALFFTSPLVLPQVVIGAAMLASLSVAGLVQTWAGLVVAHMVIVLPYVIRTVAATLAGFDRSVEEAAQDLGASPFVTFVTVTLPLIKQGVIAGGLFAFIISWINVEVSMFLTSARLLTIPVKLFNYIQYNVDPLIAAVSAATIYLALVIVILIDVTVGLERFAVPRG
jgi:putative spermidine/putrescine transport system permease protein